MNIGTSEEKKEASKVVPYWSILIVLDRLLKFRAYVFLAKLILIVGIYQLWSRRLDDAGYGCNDTISGSSLLLPLRVEKARG